MTETTQAPTGERLAPSLAQPEPQQQVPQEAEMAQAAVQEAAAERGPIQRPRRPEVGGAIETAGQAGAGRVLKAMEAVKTVACVVAGTPELVGSGTKWLKTALKYGGAWLETRPQVIDASLKETGAKIKEARAERLDIREKGLEERAQGAEKPFWKELFDFVRRQTERQARFLRQESLKRREAAATIRDTVNRAVEGGAKIVEIPEELREEAERKERRPLKILSKRERKEAKALKQAERQQQAEAEYLERKRQNAAKLGLLSRNRDKSQFPSLREFRRTPEYQQLKQQLQYELRGFGIALKVIPDTEAGTTP